MVRRGIEELQSSRRFQYCQVVTVCGVHTAINCQKDVLKTLILLQHGHNSPGVPPQSIYGKRRDY